MAQEKVLDILKSSKRIETPYNVFLTGTQDETDNALAKVGYVKSFGYGLKQVQLSAPADAPATGYVPVIFTNINHNEYCYISTKTSGGSDPMNNCVFDGIVRSGGWSDRGSYVTGQFNIYSANERALHSIHGGTEADNFYVAYVEVRAFPVTVKVPVGVNVTTNTTVSYGTSVFVTNGHDGVGNTKGRKLCDFNKGFGLYQGSGNRVYDQGFKPTPADVGTLSESAINTELDKKFDKVGGTITGLVSIEGRTTLGAYSIKRSGVTGYANFGQLAAAGTIGEAVLGIGTNQESVTSYLKVGDDKLEFVSNDLPKMVFHEGQVPTLGKDLNLQWQLPSPGGTARYVRLVTLGLTDNDATFILSGFGDHGASKRATYNVVVATRSSGISVDVNSLDVDLLYGGKPRFYHRRVGDVFEVWVKTPAFNLDATFTRMSGRGSVVRIDSTTATEPTGLIEVTVNQIYTTRFAPTANAVGALPITGGSLTGALGITHQGIGLTIRRTTYPNIVLESTDLTDHRQKYIEVTGSGALNIITRRSDGTNNGTVTIAPGQDGVVYHTGNKPSPSDLGAVSKTGDNITGQLQMSAPFYGTSNQAQIAHIGNDASRTLYIRNMREHISSSWVWEKVYNGSLYYSTGTSGEGTNKIRLSVGTTGEIYLGNADKRVYHEGYETTPAKIGAYSKAEIDTLIANLKSINGLK